MKETKKGEQKKYHEFNPTIILGIIGSTDIETLQELKEFFRNLDGFSVIYMKLSPGPLYITDRKPNNQYSKEIK